MENRLEMYKAFIDGLVERKDSVLEKWILGNGYPNTDENRDINEFLSMLSNEQKRIIVQMVIEATPTDKQIKVVMKAREKLINEGMPLDL